MIRVLVIVSAVMALAGVSQPASAQTGAGGDAPRLEIAVGGGLMGGAALGASEATLRGNQRPPSPYTVFALDAAFARSAMAEARAGYRLSRRLGVEGRLGFSRPELRASVRADVEGAAPIAVVERVDQYIVDAGVVVMIDEWRLGSLVPFAAAGGGYLRQLHEGQTVIEEGHVVHLGGGVKQWLRTRRQGFIKAAGVRADAGVYILSGGIRLDDASRSHFVISGSFVVGF